MRGTTSDGYVGAATSNSPSHGTTDQNTPPLSTPTASPSPQRTYTDIDNAVSLSHPCDRLKLDTSPKSHGSDHFKGSAVEAPSSSNERTGDDTACNAPTEDSIPSSQAKGEYQEELEDFIAAFPLQIRQIRQARRTAPQRPHFYCRSTRNLDSDARERYGTTPGFFQGQA